jgi:hypothetical protein
MPIHYPNKGLADGNYCRNPDGVKSIWCYTTDSKKRWELCAPLSNDTANVTTNETSIEKSEVFTGKGADYRGFQDKTVTGRTCQAWSS